MLLFKAKDRDRIPHRQMVTPNHPVNTWLDYSAIAHEWPRLCQVVVPVSFPSWPADAQLSPRRLGEDYAGVIQIHGAGVSTWTCGTPVPRRWTQGEFHARRRGGSGRGRGEDWSMDRPGGGGKVDWVSRLSLGLVWLMLVGGKKSQCSECTWVILAWVGGRKAKERERDLGMCRLLVGTSRIGLSVGGLSRTGVGGTWGNSSGLWWVGWSLTTIRLLGRKEEKRKKLKISNLNKWCANKF